MNESAGVRLSSFSIWLRTGRWPRMQSLQTIETKYNHWHDPRDGRFTFTGAGQHDGSWGGGDFTGGGGGTSGGGGATGSWFVGRTDVRSGAVIARPTVPANARATLPSEEGARKRPTSSTPRSEVGQRRVGERLHTLVRNGYEFRSMILAGLVVSPGISCWKTQADPASAKGRRAFQIAGQRTMAATTSLLGSMGQGKRSTILRTT